MTENTVTVTAYPDGPLIVRGPAEILDTEGDPLQRIRSTVALCRCGMTSRAPLCDGTHKLARQGARARRPSPDVG
ncbi:MAG: CDGSH iron-sulfur domain-containing protein [Actinomycetes bacterium]